MQKILLRVLAFDFVKLCDCKKIYSRFKRILRLSAISFLSLMLLTSCANMGLKSTQTKNQKATKVYTDLGFAYLEKQLYTKSLLNFRKALDYDNKNANTWHGMALIMQEEKRIKLAEEYFLKSLSLDAKNSEVLNNYALFLFKKQEYEQAKDYFSKSVQDVFNPNLGFIYINFAYCLEKLNMHKEAETYFIKAKNTSASKKIGNKRLLEYYIRNNELDKAKLFIKEIKQLGELDEEIKNLEKSLVK